MSARWIPKYGPPNRFSYQLSSRTGMGRDPAPVLPVPVDELGGDRWSRRPAVRPDPSRANSRMELADSAMAAPISVELGGLLEHIRLDASLLQCETEGQTPDAGTDDRHTRTGFSHAVEARPCGRWLRPGIEPRIVASVPGVPEVYDPRHPIASARRA